MVIPAGEPLNIDMNNPGDADFDFEIGLKPDFDITPLQNKTKLTHYEIEVSDKMVADETDRIRRRYGKVEDQETVSSKDDILYTAYELCDAEGNVATESQKTEDPVLMEKLPAKLQELLMGKKANDTLVLKPSEIAEGEELAAFLKDPLKQGAEAADNFYKLTLTKVGLLVP